MLAFPAVGPRQWQRWRSLRLAALAEAPDAFGSTLVDWQDADAGRWRSRLSIPLGLDLIAVLDGADVGMASGSPGARGAVELISMWVSPSARGAGVARGLIERVASWAAHRGAAVQLSVRPDNAAAITAYRRAGFVATAEPGDAVPGTDGHEMIMIRPLRGRGPTVTE